MVKCMLRMGSLRKILIKRAEKELQYLQRRQLKFIVNNMEETSFIMGEVSFYDKLTQCQNGDNISDIKTDTVSEKGDMKS